MFSHFCFVSIFTIRKIEIYLFSSKIKWNNVRAVNFPISFYFCIFFSLLKQQKLSKDILKKKKIYIWNNFCLVLKQLHGYFDADSFVNFVKTYEEMRQFTGRAVTTQTHTFFHTQTFYSICFGFCILFWPKIQTYEVTHCIAKNTQTLYRTLSTFYRCSRSIKYGLMRLHCTLCRKESGPFNKPENRLLGQIQFLYSVVGQFAQIGPPKARLG